MAIRFPVKFDTQFNYYTSSNGRINYNWYGLDLIECTYNEIIAIQERIAQNMIKVKPTTLYWDMYKSGTRWYESRVATGQRIQDYTGNYLAFTNGYAWGASEDVNDADDYELTYNTMYDHRLQAGAYTTSTTGYKNAANTPNTSVVSVGYKKLRYLKSTRSSSTVGARPLYWNGSELQEMSDTDIDDTFIKPAIERFTNSWRPSITSDVTAGRYSWTPYRISTSTSLSGYAGLVIQRTKYLDGTSNYGSPFKTPIFTDTNADLGKYTAGSIPETQDQKVEKRSYYMHRYNGGSKATVDLCCWNDGLKAMNGTDITTSFQDRAAYHSINTNNYRLAFNNVKYPPDTNSDSVNGYRSMGTVFDTRYTGSTYKKRKVNEDDYRTQEFPAASADEAKNDAPSNDGAYTFYVIRY